MFRDELTRRIGVWLGGVGIVVRPGSIPKTTFLPGIHLERGEIVVDEERLLYPGDLLHEAGHLAVMPLDRRLAVDGFAGEDGGEEMAAIAWSWAAALAMGLDVEVVFHPDGYRGGAEAIVRNFRAGRYFGVPILQWLGMTDAAFPLMKKWMRD